MLRRNLKASLVLAAATLLLGSTTVATLQEPHMISAYTYVDDHIDDLENPSQNKKYTPFTNDFDSLILADEEEN